MLKSTIGEEMFNKIEQIPKESIVTVKGTLSSVKNPIKSCYCTTFECMISDIIVNSVSNPESIPFTIDNANCSCEKDNGNKTLVTMSTRLNHRYYELPHHLTTQYSKQSINS